MLIVFKKVFVHLCQLKLKIMKKNISILICIVVLLLAGAEISYAAFPLANKNAVTNLVGGTSVTNAPTSTDNMAPMPTAPADGHKHGGSGKSQVIALILCILFGGIGIHRFYLGYIGIGIIQLLTLGGCGIWALIDLIRIITGDLKPANGGYDKTL